MPMEAKGMTMTRLETASFDELKAAKIALRRAGRKGGVRYCNVEWAMRRRFGRS